MNKRTTKIKANLIVSEGDGWRVEYDRVTKDYLAMINGVGCIGYAQKLLAAHQLCQEYTYRQLA